MRAIYEPAHSIEANLIVGLLQQFGIEAHIAGELPAFGLMRVMVADENAEAARQLIEEWNSGEPVVEGFFS